MVLAQPFRSVGGAVLAGQNMGGAEQGGQTVDQGHGASSMTRSLQFLTGFEAIDELIIPIAPRLLAIAGEEVGPAG